MGLTGMDRLASARFFTVLCTVLGLASCSDGGGARADGGKGGADTGEEHRPSPDAGESVDLAAGALDQAEGDAATPFIVYPLEIQASGQAGYGDRHTITITANVDLTGLSAGSSGGSIPVVSQCPTSLTAGQTCTLTVITCPSGTYSSHQESGGVDIRTSGEHSQSTFVPVHATCYSA
jgi:hypothetical protein